MGKERNGMIDYFKATFRQRAAAKAPAPATVPATPPPPPRRIPPQQVYDDFARAVTPVLEHLAALPKNTDDLEFFIRADVVHDLQGQVDQQRIDVWVFYTSEGTPAGRLHDAPAHHFISIQRKTSTPEKPDYSQLLTLSLRPVLRLSLRPYAPDNQIQSETYIEHFEKPQAGKSYGIYCGEHGRVVTTDNAQTHNSVHDLRTVITDWISAVAPDRRAEVDRLNAATARTDIAVLKPLRLKRREP